MTSNHCPNCNIPLKEAVYGMMAEPNENVITMGCMIDIPMADFGCKECGYLHYVDGSFYNPLQGGLSGGSE